MKDTLPRGIVTAAANGRILCDWKTHLKTKADQTVCDCQMALRVPGQSWRESIRDGFTFARIESEWGLSYWCRKAPYSKRNRWIRIERPSWATD